MMIHSNEILIARKTRRHTQLSYLWKHRGKKKEKKEICWQFSKNTKSEQPNNQKIGMMVGRLRGDSALRDFLS